MFTLIFDIENDSITGNHNQTMVRPLPIRIPNHNQTVVRMTAPTIWPNHNQTLRTAK
jgi:hypothetical protein